LRVLALHGGYSNSNVLKFQVAQLRKSLGKDVEWLFPDATVPKHPYGNVPEFDVFPEISAFEARLAQGKPLTSWWTLTNPEGKLVLTDSVTMSASCTNLIHLVAREEPIDVAIGFSQGALLAVFVSLQMQREGRRVPWKLAVLFCPSDPTPELRLTAFKESLPFPVVHISSPHDPHYWLAQESYGQITSEHGSVLLEHQDGYAFPMTPPRSAEIYRRIAEEVSKHCRPSASEAPAGGAAAPAAPAAEACHAAGPGRPKPGLSQPQDAVQPVSPEQLAELLLAGACLVVDTRQPEARGGRLCPGCDPRDDLSFGALQRNPRDVQRRLAHLQRDGRQVVAVSRMGDFDREYCELLVGSFGLPARRVRWLAGGLRAWASWELDCPAVAEQVRSAVGLPPRPESSTSSVSPAELAAMLLEESCLVADAREAAEARGKAFPGASKGLSLLALRRRPGEVGERLARLREDGRTVVVISVTGGRCWQYCDLLVGRFGFGAGTVRRLGGGLRGWAAWSLEHREASEDLRRQYGLAPARCSLAAPPGGAAGSAERELSVEALARYS